MSAIIPHHEIPEPIANEPIAGKAGTAGHGNVPLPDPSTLLVTERGPETGKGKGPSSQLLEKAWQSLMCRYNEVGPESKKRSIISVHWPSSSGLHEEDEFVVSIYDGGGLYTDT